MKFKFQFSKGSLPIVIAVGILGIAILGLIAGAAAFVGNRTGAGSNSSSSSTYTCGTVPNEYKVIFDKASAKYNTPSGLVAAIFSCGEHGGGWPNINGPWASSSKGAQGPFQFTPPTWTQYGIDGDNDGKKDVQNIFDAAFGAANMLSQNIKSNSGTETEKIKKAIFRYNQANWYVDQVYECYLSFACGGPTSNDGCDDPNKLMTIYGSSPSAVKSQLVTVDFMGTKVQFHKLAAPYLEAVVQEIKSSGTNYKFRRLGTYSWRLNVNNQGERSLHSFGIAIDINDDVNCNGCTTSDFPPEVINAFKKHGFRWGGNYRRTKDPMHFEWLGYSCSGQLLTK